MYTEGSYAANVKTDAFAHKGLALLDRLDLEMEGDEREDQALSVQ